MEDAPPDDFTTVERMQLKEALSRQRSKLVERVKCSPTFEHEALMVLSSLPEKIHAQESQLDRPGFLEKAWTWLTGTPPISRRRKRALLESRRILARATADNFEEVLKTQRAGLETLNATISQMKRFEMICQRQGGDRDRRLHQQAELLHNLVQVAKKQREALDEIRAQVGRVEQRQQFDIWDTRVKEQGPPALSVKSPLTALWLYVDTAALLLPSDEHENRLRDIIWRSKGLVKQQQTVNLAEMSSAVAQDLCSTRAETLRLAQEDPSCFDAVAYPVMNAVMAELRGKPIESRSVDLDVFVQSLMSERHRQIAAVQNRSSAPGPAVGAQVKNSSTRPDRPLTGSILPNAYRFHVNGVPSVLAVPEKGATTLRISGHEVPLRENLKRQTRSLFARAKLPEGSALHQEWKLTGSAQLKVVARIGESPKLEIEIGGTTMVCPLKEWK